MRWIVLMVFAVAFLAACDRTHMGEHYGTSVRTALAIEVVDRNAGREADPPGKSQGLDPQEAAIVNDTYRRSLSPRGSDEAAKRAPMLLVPAGQGVAPAPAE